MRNRKHSFYIPIISKVEVAKNAIVPNFPPNPGKKCMNRKKITAVKIPVFMEYLNLFPTSLSELIAAKEDAKAT